jgi:deoxycytidine triphosphate deaminase
MILEKNSTVKSSLFIIEKEILSDRGLNSAIKTGKIVLNPLNKRQIQPSSLDLRIGSISVFDDEVRRKAGKKGYLSIEDSLKMEKFAKHYSKDSEAVNLAPKSFSEIYSYEDITFNEQEYSLSFELKSSRGRLFLTPDSSRIQYNNKKVMISVWNNNPNTVRLYVGSPFMQLFFHPLKNKGDGYIVTCPKEAKKIAEKIVKDDFQLFDAYLVFTLGKKILKFKENIGIIDTNKRYDDNFLYNILDASKKQVLEPGEAIIAQLSPRLELPSDVGIRLLWRVPYAESQDYVSKIGFHTDNHYINAGWIDPGYKGNATAHPIRQILPMHIQTGTPLALGLLYKYKKDVLHPYGSEHLNSHYQNSHGSGHRS